MAMKRGNVWGLRSVVLGALGVGLVGFWAAFGSGAAFAAFWFGLFCYSAGVVLSDAERKASP